MLSHYEFSYTDPTTKKTLYWNFHPSQASEVSPEKQAAAKNSQLKQKGFENVRNRPVYTEIEE